MSVQYTPVIWNRNKMVYDAILLIAVALYLYIFIRVGPFYEDVTRPIDGAILRMRAFGSCAFLMLTVILCIGPLARLDRRFLPLLYNRRHFGVMTAGIAAVHATMCLAGISTSHRQTAMSRYCRPTQATAGDRLSLRGFRYRCSPDPVRTGCHQP